MKPISKSIEIIQGGMGVGVSNWCLAKAVAKLGQLGVVSGTGLETILIRRLQIGDQDGSVRRALSHFPWPEMAQNILNKYFISGGKPQEQPFLRAAMPVIDTKPESIQLTVISNFVEVFLAKEGHDGHVGINYLEKIQLPTMASLLGAMLAGVNFILMGGGIPIAIPGLLDGLANWEPVELRINVADDNGKTFTQTFDPASIFPGQCPPLERPHFLAIISSDIVAHSMIRRASGYVDGFVVENFTAGGHNASPRRVKNVVDADRQQYTDKDVPNIEKIRKLGRPFWIAGGYASPEKLREAQAQGAHGVQVGTAFCYCQESGILNSIKREVIDSYQNGTLQTVTDFQASPTGYPFKLIYLANSSRTPQHQRDRVRYCDLGYLRQVYCDANGNPAYRCPAETVEHYIKKGGEIEKTQGKQCLCNGLLSTIGLGQIRPEGEELPIITAGEDFSFLDHFVTADKHEYSAEDVVKYLKG
jgi:nitronate monooxygenase